MNQENPHKCLFYPPFEVTSTATCSDVASFTALQRLHTFNEQNLIELVHKLPFKALNPFNAEQGNIRLALRVFSSSVAEGVGTSGDTLDLPHAEGTANFIEIMAKWWAMAKWWSIYIPKTGAKGCYLNNDFKQFVTCMDMEQRLSS